MPSKKDNRPSSTERGYDGKWNQLRALFLKRNKACVVCGKEGADTVDHMMPIRTHPELRLDWKNLRAMHHACHSKYTMTIAGQDPRQEAYVGACDADGLPTDHRHPWNSGSIKTVPPRYSFKMNYRKGMYGPAFKK